MMTKKILILTLSLLTITLVSKAQVEIVSGGTSAAYTVAVPGTFVLTSGLQVTFKAHTANSASATLNVSGTGAVSITKIGGSAPLSGSDILTNQIVTVAYDGTNWQMLSAVGSTPAASNDWTTTGNGGTNAATNYIGTSDPTDLSFRTNGVLKARLTQKGQLEILNTGSSIFIGSGAGANDDLSNRQNTFVGDFAGNATSTGNWNTALGYGALTDNITGTSNTAIGRTTLSYSTGSNNTATGTYSLFWGTTGSGNTGTGAYAGQTVTTGTNNTFLGYNTDVTDATLTNATAIGYNAKVGQSNSLVLGGTGADIVNVGIGTVTPNERLHVVGDINVSNAIKLNGDPGTAGQVLTSGGGGGADTWSTPAASVNIYNNNGSLTAARTVTQGANTLAFTATSVNAFSIDGSTFSVDATNNNVGIGTTAPSEKLHVTGGQIYNNWSSPNGPANVFIRNWNSVSGPGYNTGTLGQVTIVTSDAAEIKYAIQGHAGGDSGGKVGVYGASMGLGTNYGGYFSANGGSDNYALYVVGNAAGTSNAHGIYSTAQGNGSGTTYGIYAQNSSSSTGATYAGNFENFNSTGSIIYGVRSSLTGNAGGTVTKYGIRSDVIGTASSNVGGYFRAVGGTTNHAIQLVDGSEANNRVLASDAAGMATWTDLSTLTSGGATAWTKTGTSIYQTVLTDNVGIGTASPAERLDVTGNIQSSTGYKLSGIAGTTVLYNSGTILVLNNTLSQPIRLTQGGNARLTVAASGNVGIGTTTPVGMLDVTTSTLLRGSQIQNSFSSASDKYGIYAIASGSGAGDNNGAWFDASGTATGINYGVGAQALGSAGENRAVYGFASGGTTNWAGYFAGGNVYIQNNLGIGVTPSYKLHVNGDAYVTTNLGVGVAPTATYAVDATGSAYGIRAIGTTMGGRFQDNGDGSVAYVAYGTYGIYTQGETSNYFSGNVGIGITVPNRSLQIHEPSTGVNYLQITNTNSGSTSTDGILLGTNGSSALFWNYEATSMLFGTSGTSRMSISAAGAVDVVGTLSKGGGTFKIDHPLDPENKFLYHSFVESPDMMNIYNGNITTNSNGDAIVSLPDYFDVLNMEFRYQLTVIGTFAQAIVMDKINGNKFTIKTDHPNVEVSWQVTGVRKDPFANAHRVIPEVEKSADEKGKYLYPLESGKSKEQGIFFEVEKEKK